MSESITARFRFSIDETTMVAHSLKDLLVCPDCNSAIEFSQDPPECSSCRRSFHLRDGVLDMMPAKSIPAPHFYQDPDYLSGKEKIGQWHDLLYRKDSFSGRLESYFKRELMKIVTNPVRPYLDIGCGTGTMFASLEYPQEIIGVDISFELLHKCKRLYPKAECILCDITRSPFRENSLATIFASGTLEHIFFMESFIQAIEKMLKGNGFFYALIPTEGGFLWKMLRNLAHYKYSKRLGINYRRYAAKEHCNTAAAVDNALRKTFLVDCERSIPWRIGGNSINLVKIYRLKKRSF